MQKNIVPFRVLSLDGGGMRGLYTVALLDKLALLFARGKGEDQLDIGAGFDLITGTSTGGIIAGALAAGVPIQEMIALYKKDGPKIFKDPVPEHSFKKLAWAYRHRNRAGNFNQPLKDALSRIFGSQTLEELYQERGIALCIPSVTMSTHQSRVFKTPHLPHYQMDNNLPVADVCLATSAAPLVLPLAVTDDPDSPGHHKVFADGGLWANNPVLIGMIEALELAAPGQPIEILSLSTCAPPSGDDIDKDDANWGLQDWSIGLGALETALDAQSSGYNFMAIKLAQHLNRECRVVRLPPSPPSQENSIHIGLDKASAKAARILIDLGQNDAANVYGKISRKESQDMECIASIFNAMPPLEKKTP